MSTQGLIAVVDGDKVLMKIVAGCNGQQAGKLAKWLWQQPELPDIFVVQGVANTLDFGCDACRVIQIIDRSLFDASLMTYELWEHYERHFSEPRFNPRLPTGEAPAHTVVLDISKKKTKYVWTDYDGYLEWYEDYSAILVGPNDVLTVTDTCKDDPDDVQLYAHWRAYYAGWIPARFLRRLPEINE